ncbi:pentapeptide repeat-containing protein [Streptosporangium sp. NPDC020072]|uniref:pentapeptide repeat-containing protein n=1 Tax=Streptosporangium sp. NPDC020072 TaxID=3154788 RepID=UPI00344AFFF6
MPRPVGWWIVPATLAVGGAFTAVAWWLLTGLSGLSGAVLVTARVEIIRTALAAGVGMGGAITLMLAFRRQRHQEIATAITEHDAAERRITELYTKAAEQLGSDKAPVRLAGLYALERLAQDTPALRQTIVDVISAYLRMPYTLPAQTSRSDKIRAAQRAARTRTSPTSQKNGHDPHEERQVRLTAQRILADHLHYPTPPDPAKRRRWQRPAAPSTRFWPNIRLDLTDATLIDLNFTSCRIAEARFDRANFQGHAVFEKATFQRSAGFAGANFHGHVAFVEANFQGLARFEGANFHGHAIFAKVTFQGHAEFEKANFQGHSVFEETTFQRPARFEGTTFQRPARFEGTTFQGSAVFEGTTFQRSAVFEGTTFQRSAVFEGTTFQRSARFEGTTFQGPARFAGTTFQEKAGLIDVRMSWPDHENDWPSGWTVVRQEDGSGRLRHDAEAESPHVGEAELTALRSGPCDEPQSSSG